MTSSEIEQLKSCLKQVSEILYNNCDNENLETFADIEQMVREQVLEFVSPQIGFFFIQTKTGTTQGKKRTIKSCVGEVIINTKQAQILGIEPYKRHSPLLEKCTLVLSANESYQNAQEDMFLLTGIKIGHSTIHRQVQQIDNILPDMKQSLSEVAIDGGTIRLRGEQGEKSQWKEYKVGRLQGIYQGAFFQDNDSLINWINSQKRTRPLFCIGDGHDGVWNIIGEIGEKQHRIEILDWYHLMENLYKTEGNKHQIDQLKAYLWMGEVAIAINYLNQEQFLGAHQFSKYLQKHQSRIVNYHYLSWQKVCSIGSGAVESAVKQIGHRVKLTGAQWKKENVPKILQLRCAYLNGQLGISTVKIQQSKLMMIN
ncbi:ISKra4 family transposase [Geminocystis sp. CENA526]|uniref:ISKra4 family transposase n=1 Tax=Geminocystis sp. CENA526 TaxID=1355871 RepID=UPI003D6DB109